MNPELLQDHLKGVMGFEGFVMSDWWSMLEAVPGAPNGLDQNMPGTLGSVLDTAALPDADLDGSAAGPTRARACLAAAPHAALSGCAEGSEPACSPLEGAQKPHGS